MACFSPLSAWKGKPQSNGKLTIVWNRRDSWRGQRLDLPCGQCIGCRLERSRQWAMRCLHEASLHRDNCFVTLTYDDKHLPPNGSLCFKHFQDFMKRLRKRYGSGIRFFHCGEYGELLSRPHYHLLLFGFNFPDRVRWSTRLGHPVFKSESLDQLWGHGLTEIGELTFESAAYVARYVTKKITGDNADAHYEGKDPEYCTMSRRPGIGSDWFSKFKSDVFPSDSVILRGKEVKPPKFYLSRLELTDPDMFCSVKSTREVLARKNVSENMSDRLAVREKVKLLQFKNLKRPLEVTR